VKHRATAALAAVAALAALTACSSNDDDKPAPAKSSAAASATPDALKAAGIPPKPTGKTRTDLLAALRKVSPSLVADEADAVDNARNQCSTINGGGNADSSAQARFTSGAHTVSAAEAKQINAALAAYCATA
jgi:ABC-type glycerol-3-phosphate transport system substrate-binding protein